jgi:hypothetical protein
VLDLEDERVADLFVGAERAWAQAKLRVAEGEQELQDFVRITGLGHELMQAGIKQRQEALDQAKRELYELDDPGLGHEDPLVASFFGTDGSPQVLEGRGDNPERDRQRMRRVISSVTLSQADSRRRHQPISERVSIRWVGQTEGTSGVAHSRRGKRAPAKIS